jgi:hypothetical protein
LLGLTHIDVKKDKYNISTNRISVLTETAEENFVMKKSQKKA